VLSDGRLFARAQQASKVYRLGYLAPAPIPHIRDALFEALRDLRCVEGPNLKTEYRYGAAEVLEALAVELVALQPDVIVTVGTPPALAAKRATKRIPIVMATAGDPVRLGVVSGFARPGGNVTGVTLYGTELNAKRIELFREAIPGIKRIAFLANAKNLYGQFYGRRRNLRRENLAWNPSCGWCRKWPTFLRHSAKWNSRKRMLLSSFRTHCSTVRGGRSSRSLPNIICR
jgi:putative tryptophan/tyrosine transport system substrate-binding protein